MSANWLHFLGHPGSQLHVFIDTSRMGGAYYLKFYVEGSKAALDKIETISSPQTVNDRFNALYAPLAQGGMNRGYVIGRGRRDEVGSQEQLPSVIEEIQQCYFAHFADQLDDDDDLLLPGDEDDDVPPAKASGAPETTDEALATLGGEVSVPPVEHDERPETVRVPFCSRPVEPAAKLGEELEGRMLAWWHLPRLCYDPGAPLTVFAYWENFVGISLKSEPKTEKEYLFLFAELLEEIIKTTRPYVGASRRFRLAQIAGEVRRVRAAFPDHLTPFVEAMAWQYLELLVDGGAGATSPQENPWLASLIRAAVTPAREPRVRLTLEASLPDAISPFEVWAFYNYYAEQGALSDECERGINEALVQSVLSLPRGEQAEANEGWKAALASAKRMVGDISATLARYESELI